MLVCRQVIAQVLCRKATFKQQGSGLLEPQRGKMTVKVKRKDDKGAEQEIEIEESDILETDVKVLPPEAGKTNQEKTLTQSEVNKLLADERRKHDAKYNELKGEYTTFKTAIEQREQAANDAAAEKVEALRKDLPEPIIKLLDNLSPVAQLEWLSDPANVITKKEIPPLPNAREQGGQQRKIKTIV